MNLIRTRLHGFIDYGLGITLLIPWITLYYAGEKDTWVFSATGFFIISYSLFTNYEAGLIRLLPVSLNRWLDAISGLFLLVCSFAFTVNHYYFYWALLLGAGMLGLAIVSASAPHHKKSDANITQPL